MGTSDKRSIRYLSALILGIIGVFPVLFAYTAMTDALILASYTGSVENMPASFVTTGMIFALGVLLMISSVLIKRSSKNIRRFFLILAAAAGVIPVAVGFKQVEGTGAFIIGSLLYLLPCIYIFFKALRKKKKMPLKF